MAEPHARDLCAEVELAHHVGERRLVGAGDEHRVRGEDRSPRRDRHSLRRLREGNSPERDVGVLDLEPVESGDLVEREDGSGHELSRCSAPGHACNLCGVNHAAASSKTSSRVTRPPASARSLNRRKARSSSPRSSLKPRSAHARANAWRPECFPSGSVMRAPTSNGSMIWYVRSSLSIPSWWMPASWANA